MWNQGALNTNLEIIGELSKPNNLKYHGMISVYLYYFPSTVF